MTITSFRNLLLSATVGAIIGLMLAAGFIWARDLVQFRFDIIRKFERPLKSVAGEPRLKTLKTAEDLVARAGYLSLLKAVLEHGAEGAVEGAVVGLAFAFAMPYVRREIEQDPLDATGARAELVRSARAISKYMNWLFDPLTDDLSFRQIVDWWQKRRLMYNMVVGSTFVVSMIANLFFWSTSGLLSPSDDVIEPVMLMPMLFFVAVLVNLLYCLGAAVQSLAPRSLPGLRRSLGPLLFKLGLALSLFLLSLPAIDSGCAWLHEASIGFPNDHALSLYD